MLNEKYLKKTLAWILAGYILFVLVWYFAGGDRIRFKTVDTGTMISPARITGELLSGDILEQPFVLDAEEIRSVVLKAATFARENSGNLSISLRSGSALLAEVDVPFSELRDNDDFTVLFPDPVAVKREEPLRIVVESSGSPGNSVAFYYGNTITLPRGEIEKKFGTEEVASLNHKPLNGVLCFRVTGRKSLWFGRYFWFFAAAGGAFLAAYGAHSIRAFARGRHTFAVIPLAAFIRYRFLIQQLVARDFKTKYKRSVLGVFWSFLNPILTMAVQYFVFSTIFRSNIENFALYLLTGIVCFNFFIEATNMALTSIVNNASLITKVYVPKYIYPMTRILSSSINLAFSLIPLFAVMLFSGLPFPKALLLLPFGLLCLLSFSMGVGFLLSALMVFFRDTQFLWGVLGMLWMFMTPIFYPETIIPIRFLAIYRLNPLYHIIGFIRSIMISGVSPEPFAFLLCFAASVTPLVVGLFVFKKTQDKFVLNL